MTLVADCWMVWCHKDATRLDDWLSAREGEQPTGKFAPNYRSTENGISGKIAERETENYESSQDFLYISMLSNEQNNVFFFSDHNSLHKFSC